MVLLFAHAPAPWLLGNGRAMLWVTVMASRVATATVKTAAKIVVVNTNCSARQSASHSR
ncbi:MAG: hypothetical protein IPL28_13695 [Chloroflexi bacterium]|nr:hypothetical protein [Chloroflexota bacterium]